MIHARKRLIPIAAATLCLFAGSASAQDETPDATAIQNAVLEGVNFSTEKGATADEQIITCYFIFKDKPTSYYYNKMSDPKTKEKKIIFEFNDTQIGTSPISYEVAQPITTFKIDKDRFNANAEVKGLNPEWHDKMVVTFNVNSLPKLLTVSDQYNIISFSYKWTSDAGKTAQYAESDKKSPVVPIILSTSGGVVAAISLWLIFGPGKGETPVEEPLRIDDLPQHVTYQ